jgi:hypothetical protein
VGGEQSTSSGTSAIRPKYRYGNIYPSWRTLLTADRALCAAELARPGATVSDRAAERRVRRTARLDRFHDRNGRPDRVTLRNVTKAISARSAAVRARPMMPTVAVLRACSGRPGSALPGQGANEPIGAFDHPGSRYAPILDGTDLEAG